MTVGSDISRGAPRPAGASLTVSAIALDATDRMWVAVQATSNSVALGSAADARRDAVQRVFPTIVKVS
jgi:hypothetical protein